MKTFILLLCCVPLVAFAGTARIEAVNVGVHQGYTRVTLAMSGHADHSIFTLGSPDRVVLDVSSAKLVAKLPAGRGIINDFRSGRHGHGVRIVFDLQGRGVPRSFFLPASNGQPARLVVDVYGKSAATLQPVAVSTPESNSSSRDIVIAVDAGHGGFDPGAHGPNGLLEKNVTLAVAKKLAAMIDAVPGMRAVLTRKDDRYLKLRQRTAIARADNADLFVSIHCNASEYGSADGGAVFALSQHGATSEAARWLAHRENSADDLGGVSLSGKSPMLASVLLDLSQTATISASLKVAKDVLNQLGQVEPLHQTRVEQAAFVVLKSPDIPSILVETAFITNPHEEHLLSTSRYQQQLATSVLDGIINYYKDYPPPGTWIAAHDGDFEGQRYVINRGDTLSGIADRFNVSLQTLEAINGLSGATIRAGEVLTIPTS